MNAFNHNFQKPINMQTFHEMNGYIYCMRALMMKLQEMTQFKPEKRMVDSVELLEAITATQVEFEPLVQDFKERLQNEYIGD
jgi:hypothetical protein